MSNKQQNIIDAMHHVLDAMERTHLNGAAIAEVNAARRLLVECEDESKTIDFIDETKASTPLDAKPVSKSGEKDSVTEGSQVPASKGTNGEQVDPTGKTAA